MWFLAQTKPRLSDQAQANTPRTGCITNGVLALPAHLKKTNYVNPSNGVKSAFQDGFRTSSHFFEYLKENPSHAEQFNNHMTAYHQGRPSWMDEGFFPVQSLTEGLNVSAEDVLLVDVGGGVGHDLTEFRRKWPNIPGRLVLQDLPEVIDQAKAQNQATASFIEPVAHDFFSEQPVKGTYLPSFIFSYVLCNKLTSFRLPSILHALRPPRLGRRRLPTHPVKPRAGHEARVQQDPDQRERDPEHERLLGDDESGHHHDGGLCIAGAYGEAVARAYCVCGFEDC